MSTRKRLPVQVASIGLRAVSPSCDVGNPPPCSTAETTSNRSFLFIFRETRRLNVRHWPPAEPSVVPHAGTGSSGDSFFPGEGGGGAPGRPSTTGAGGGAAETRAPRAVILAGSLSELPRSMRLGGAVVFTNLSSPEAWRYVRPGGSGVSLTYCCSVQQ